MPAIELPNGQSAILFSKDEISERTARRISGSYLKAAAIGGKMVEENVDLSDSQQVVNAMAHMTDEERADLSGFDAAVIVGMVRSWTLGDLPTAETVLDLPQNIFRALAKASSDEFNRIEEFGPDGAIDPKAPTAN